MRNRLNLAFIKHECGFDKRFTISGRAGVDNLHTFRQLVINILDGRNGCAKRISFIIMIKRIQKSTVFSDQGSFCGGRTCIDSKECLSSVGCKIFYRNLMLCMACGKFFIVFRGCKERIKTFHFKFHLDLSFKTLLHFKKSHRSILFGIESRTDRSK